MKNKKNRFKKFILWDLDLLLLSLPVLFAIIFLIDSRTYNPTAALFPRLVAVITLCLLLGAILQHCWKHFRRPSDVKKIENDVIEEKKTGGLKWYLNLSVMLAYFLLVYILGLVWASLLYLMLTPILMGYKNFKIIAVIAVSWIIIFIYVFYGILQLRMPNGIFEFLF